MLFFVKKKEKKAKHRLINVILTFLANVASFKILIAIVDLKYNKHMEKLEIYNFKLI